MSRARRFDYGEIRDVVKTPQGFLRLPGYVTRVGVFPYRSPDGTVRNELRHPDDVFSEASLATLRQAPVTVMHPPVMLDPKNVGKYVKGWVSDRVDVCMDKIETDLTISHQDAIDAVERGGLREISAGYLADVVPEVGIYQGVPYDHRQKNIEYNHVAIVDRGRAGPTVRLHLDSADAEMQPVAQATQPKEQAMPGPEMEKVKLGDAEYEMPKQAAAAVKSMKDEYEATKAKLDDLMASKKDEAAVPSDNEKKEENKKDADPDKDGDKDQKKDVDIGQKNISPKVPEVQMAPDGRSASKKMDALQARCDRLEAELDTLRAGKKEVRTDSDEFRTAVQKRVKLEKAASALLPAEKSAKFDSMSDEEIRKAAIQHRFPESDLEGKSAVYLEARFDSLAERAIKAKDINSKFGQGLLAEKKFDGADPKAAREKAHADSKLLWKEPLAQAKGK